MLSLTLSFTKTTLPTKSIIFTFSQSFTFYQIIFQLYKLCLHCFTNVDCNEHWLTQMFQMPLSSYKISFKNVKFITFFYLAFAFFCFYSTCINLHFHLTFSPLLGQEYFYIEPEFHTALSKNVLPRTARVTRIAAVNN